MQQSLELICENLQQLPAVAAKLLAFIDDYNIVLLEAEMGSGKTTFIKECCSQLGSKDAFSSPSFSLINEYEGREGVLYHFDLYRIKSLEELLDLGIEDYLASGARCFIEWPEKLESFLQDKFVKILITRKEDIRYFRAVKF